MKTAKPTRRVLSLATVALAGVVILSLAATAAAESGTSRLTFAYLQDYTIFEFADQTTIAGGALEGAGTIIESSGDPFVVGENSRTTCMAYAKQSEAGLESEVPCVTTNAMGEELFTLAKRTPGDGGEGRIQILGGTGKYAGITGSCSYETEYLADNWLVSTAECEWELP